MTPTKNQLFEKKPKNEGCEIQDKDLSAIEEQCPQESGKESFGVCDWSGCGALGRRLSHRPNRCLDGVMKTAEYGHSPKLKEKQEVE
jgi:hypothetical protein